jgi:hypothetical protein
MASTQQSGLQRESSVGGERAHYGPISEIDHHSINHPTGARFGSYRDLSVG